MTTSYECPVCLRVGFPRDNPRRIYCGDKCRAVAWQRRHRFRRHHGCEPTDILGERGSWVVLDDATLARLGAVPTGSRHEKAPRKRGRPPKPDVRLGEGVTTAGLTALREWTFIATVARRRSIAAKLAARRDAEVRAAEASRYPAVPRVQR
jgi:hypothetical protein